MTTAREIEQGDIVIFMGEDGVDRAAMVTKAHSNILVNLMVFVTGTDDHNPFSWDEVKLFPGTNSGSTKAGPWWRMKGQALPSQATTLSKQDRQGLPVYHGMDLYSALALLKAGRLVRRAAWDVPDSVSTTALFMYRDDLMEVVGSGKHAYQARWRPSLEDLSATDWSIHPDDHLEDKDTE